MSSFKLKTGRFGTYFSRDNSAGGEIEYDNKMVLAALNELAKIEAQNKELIETVKFYADRDNWMMDEDCEERIIAYEDIEDQIGGKHARATLKNLGIE